VYWARDAEGDDACGLGAVLCSGSVATNTDADTGPRRCARLCAIFAECAAWEYRGSRSSCEMHLEEATHVKPSPDAWGAACYAKAGWSPGLAAERRKAEGSGAAATDWRREWSAPSSGRSAGACRTATGGRGDQTTTWGLSEDQCRSKCAAAADCVAIEHARPGGHPKCELHRTRIARTSPNPTAKCWVKKEGVDWSRYTPPETLAVLVARVVFPAAIFGPPPVGSSDGACVCAGGRRRRDAAGEVRMMGAPSDEIPCQRECAERTWYRCRPLGHPKATRHPCRTASARPAHG